MVSHMQFVSLGTGAVVISLHEMIVHMDRQGNTNLIVLLLARLSGYRLLSRALCDQALHRDKPVM